MLYLKLLTIKDTKRKSENYTLSQNPNLKLFALDLKYIGDDWIDQEDIDYAPWLSDTHDEIEFWASSENEAIGGLKNNILNYQKANLHNIPFTHSNYPDKHINAWLEIVLNNKQYSFKSFSEAAAFVDHIRYVYRKFNELIMKFNQFGEINGLEKFVANNYTIIKDD